MSFTSCVVSTKQTLISSDYPSISQRNARNEDEESILRQYFFHSFVCETFHAVLIGEDNVSNVTFVPLPAIAIN